MAKREFFQVGLQRDIVGEYFGEIHKKYEGKKWIETETFLNSNTRLTILTVDNRTVAFVIEKRTEFNDIEFIYDEVIPHEKT